MVPAQVLGMARGSALASEKVITQLGPLFASASLDTRSKVLSNLNRSRCFLSSISHNGDLIPKRYNRYLSPKQNNYLATNYPSRIRSLNAKPLSPRRPIPSAESQALVPELLSLPEDSYISKNRRG